MLKNRGMRANMNKTKVMISGECQKPVQKAARWPCGVCGRGAEVLVVKQLLLLLFQAEIKLFQTQAATIGRLPKIIISHAWFHHEMK